LKSPEKKKKLKMKWLLVTSLYHRIASRINFQLVRKLSQSENRMCFLPLKIVSLLYKLSY